jgi:hypothetical protein
MRYFLIANLLVFLSGAASAEEFAIQIASPVAAQSYNMKRSAFVFRTLGCAAPEIPEVSAKAEGRVNAQRKTLPLKVSAAQTPGVFGIFREWPEEGVWIVNIKGRCGSKSAGALVATDPKGFVRESSTLLSRPAAEADIEASLKLAARR